ncbi:hypothetical protein CQW23_01136 [Capsicum baccatum]|uniref:Uncharacterized protein n=1 Tax=Capsicum baccatum TaxID=33114 RepID=A0A2G2XMQ5_CAPBA|nr:hypothetical protein CQW23_01136 [Capsicum baccatum]
MPVTMFMVLNVLLHKSANNSIYTIASTEQSANNDDGNDMKDEDIEIQGKYQQAEVDDDDSDLLEQDNQTEVNFAEFAISAASAGDGLGIFLKDQQLKILKALDKKSFHDKELQRTKKEDNDHRNLYLEKVGFYCTPGAEVVSVRDMYKRWGEADEQNVNQDEGGKKPIRYEQDLGANEENVDQNGGGNSSIPDGTLSRPECRHENSGYFTSTGPATESFPIELREGDGKHI